MALYDDFADHYDQVFPLKEEVVAFLADLVASPKDLLDLGCATGALCLALSRLGHRVTGLDRDERMVARAREGAAGAGLEVEFRAAPMEEAGELFRGRRFDLASCLGNTLVHLSSPGAVGAFLQDLRSLLAPGGLLVVQIVNYRRILAGGIGELPPIENDRVRFRRVYRRDREPGRLLFETELLVKGSGRVVRGAVPLLPLRPAELERLLAEAGFALQGRWAGFSRKPYTPDSPGLLVLAGAGRCNP